MNIFALLKVTKDLTNSRKSYRRILILKHPQQFLEMNTKQISQECYVSTSSIYRLCEKLNLSGLSELKVRISGSIESYLKENDFTYHGISNKKGSKRPTVDRFAKDHKSGIFFLNVANHCIAVVDGYYYDTWESGSCCLYGYWEKDKRNGKQ